MSNVRNEDSSEHDGTAATGVHADILEGRSGEAHAASPRVDADLTKADVPAAGGEMPDWLASHEVSVGGVSLDDIIGLAAAKQEITSLVARLRHPEVMLAAGGELVRGVLLWGAPGCGKTLIARVIAALCGDEVRFFAIAASDLSAGRLEELGHFLRTRPAKEPRMVIYCDEADHFALRRTDYRHTETTRATLLAALAVIDGLDVRTGQSSLWLISTNAHPAELDPALVRSGRFGFQIEVPPPTRSERAEILAFYAKSRRCAPDIDWLRAASLCSSSTSPADLKAYLDDALALALAEQGAEAIVEWQHVERAIVRQGRVTEGRPMTAEERHSVAIHEAAHALAAVVHEKRSPTAIALRRDGGRTLVPEEEHAPFREIADDQVRAMMVTTLAGLSADRIILGAHRVGGMADLARATELALARIENGMDPAAPPISYGQFEDAVADEARLGYVSAACHAARSTADAFVAEHRTAIEHLARALESAGQLTGAELEAAIEGALAIHASPVSIAQ
jgi:cell division protease FtsH